jgi:hypothetical protein
MAGSVDAGFASDSGTKYTTGGQIGAPNEGGCCEDPPTTTGRDSDCPWGDWEHNHHSGPDDTGNMSGGSFAFHSGTAAAPDTAFIKSIICADEGWCVQARPAPNKQIYWEGTGVFHNLKGPKNTDLPLPNFPCEVQPTVWDKKTGGSLHYYRAHVGDFGEPAGQRQKPVTAASCPEDLGSCVGDWSIAGCNAIDGSCVFKPAPVDDMFTALHPLCTAQDCGCDVENDPSCQTKKVGCPDWYDIEIHCTADPNSAVIYKVGHFILEGNFQLHPPVGDSCQPCGDGICQAEFDETCVSCPEDCGSCPPIQ